MFRVAFWERAGADAVVVFHLGFIVFVLGGGLLVMRWRRVAWAHLPAVAWGMFVEWSGWICPLTYLENWLRERAGGAAYQEGFVDHYVVPIVYPASLTRNFQIVFGGIVAVVNLGAYGLVLYRARRRRWARRVREATVPVAQ